MPSSSSISGRLCAEGTLGALFDALPEAFLFVDAGGVIQAANRRLHDFFGVAPADAVGKPINSLAETLARCFTEFMTYHEVIAMPLQDREQEYLRDVEVSFPHHLFLQIVSAPVRSEDGTTGRLWTMRDITREREITELKIQYGGLRASDELKSKFLTVISHQLRTPLNSVRWNTELLLGGDIGSLPPESLEILRDIYRSAVGSISIVDDMLLAVDIEQRTIRLEKSAVDPADIINKVVHDFSRSASLKSISISLKELPKDMPRLFLDHDKIETVLSRLLDNAIHYTSEHGTVEVEARVGKADVSISIRDQGIGIPEKERSRVFERFYRSKKAIEMHPNASGLGLYIAKYLIDAHDGTIAFVSEEGKGTTFTVTLPKRPAN